MTETEELYFLTSFKNLLSPLRRDILVSILLLRRINKLLQLSPLLLGLLINLRQSTLPVILRHFEPPLHGGTLPQSRQPRLDGGELVVGDGQVLEAVHPAKECNVGDAVLAAARADDVVSVLETGVENAVETLGFTDVALDAIWDLLFGVEGEVVCLTLPVDVLDTLHDS